MYISVSTQTQTSSNKFNKTSLLKSKSSEIIKNLLKQKEDLIENKQELMDKKSKDSENSSSLTQEIKDIDRQIEEINSKVSKIQSDDKREAMGAKDNQGRNSKRQWKKDSENGYQVNSSKMMNNVLSMSNNLAKVKVLSAEKASMLGESRVCQAEVKLDISRGINPVAKIKRVSEIESSVSEISDKIGDIYKDNEQSTTSNKVTGENEDYSRKENKKSSKKVDAYSKEICDNPNQKGEKINTTV